MQRPRAPGPDEEETASRVRSAAGRGAAGRGAHRPAAIADGEHTLPRVTHRGASIAALLARACGLPVALVDLGEAGGPAVAARDEEESERVAAAWRPPRETGAFTLVDGATGGEIGHGVALPVTLSGRSGWLAVIAPDAAQIRPGHHDLLALIVEFCRDFESERTATALWVDRLRAEGAFLDRVHALTGMGTLSCTLADGHVQASPRAREILRSETIEGVADIVSIVAPHDRIALHRALTGQEATERTRIDCEVCPGGGRSTMARLIIGHITENGQRTGWIATVEDITETHREIGDLRRLAERDPVTGLYNRNRLARALADAHAQAREARSLVGLVLITIDGLRGINALHGHATGDVFLKFVAGTLIEQVRTGDEVMRIGSADFAVLLFRVTDEEAILRRAEAIRAALDTSVAVGIHRIDVRATIGLAVYPADTASGLDLLTAASYALNEAAEKKSPIVHRYRADIRDRRERERRLIEEVTRALRNGEFTPFFQPKVDLESGRVVGFEALCRWRHPERGILTPGAFHQALTSPVVSAELSDVSLVGSFKAARIWRGMGLPFGSIAVNLSATQLARPHLVAMVEDLQRRFEVETTDISFEVLENVLIEDADTAQDNLKALSHAGFTIALDDFGTGFASLTHIRDPYISEVKIDRSFVTHAGSNARDQQIVAAIVQMARKLGLGIVAEGIEDEETLRKLCEVGCSVGQGFVFSPALPFEEASEFLGRQHRIFGMLE